VLFSACLSEIPKYKPPPLYRLKQKSLEEEGGRSNILVRLFEPVDIAVMKSSFTRIGIYQNWLEGYLSEQEKGERTILVAYSESSFAGFVTVKWHADYRSFAEKGIPIIEDLNVLPAFRRKRIASALIDEAEKQIFSRSAMVGIGVGV
jgi:ribosomal protein S18 acetylase RimI-like enzyme